MEFEINYNEKTKLMYEPVINNGIKIVFENIEQRQRLFQ